MNRDLIEEIVRKTGLSKNGLRTTLSRLKKRHDLRSTQQAACLYIKKNGLDINVSSVIDDVTRARVQDLNNAPSTVGRTPRQPVTASRRVKLPQVRWLPRRLYSLAPRLAEFYAYLFVFENALRDKIHTTMEAAYKDWWESKLRHDLPDVYAYAASEKANQARLPMMEYPGSLTPIQRVTLGHLERIVQKYQPLFVPVVFPNLEFFTGHMLIVKRVRNAVAHMTPTITGADVRNATNEIDILLQHLSSLP